MGSRGEEVHPMGDSSNPSPSIGAVPAWVVRTAIASLVFSAVAVLGMSSLAAAQAGDNPTDFVLVEQKNILGDASALSGIINNGQTLVGVDDDDGEVLCIARDSEGRWSSAAYRSRSVDEEALNGFDLEAITLVPGPSSLPLLVAWERTDAQANDQSGFARISTTVSSEFGDALLLDRIGPLVDVPSIVGSSGIQAIAALDDETVWVGRQAPAALSQVDLTSGATIGSAVTLEGIDELEAMTFKPGDPDHVWVVGRDGANWVVRKHLVSTGSQVGGDLAVTLSKPGGLTFASSTQANDATTLIVVGEPPQAGQPSQVAVYRVGGGTVDPFYLSQPCEVSLAPRFLSVDTFVENQAALADYEVASTQPGCSSGLSVLTFEAQSGLESGRPPLAIFANDGTVCVYTVTPVGPILDENGDRWNMLPVEIVATDLQATGLAASPLFRWQRAGDYSSEQLVVCTNSGGELERAEVIGLVTGATFIDAVLTVNGEPTTALGTGEVNATVFDRLDSFASQLPWRLERTITGLVTEAPAPEWSGIAQTDDGFVMVDDGGSLAAVTVNPSQIDLRTIGDHPSFTTRSLDLEGVTRVGSFAPPLFVASWERIISTGPGTPETNKSGVTFFTLASDGTVNVLGDAVTDLDGGYPANGTNHGLEGIAWVRTDQVGDDFTEVFYAVKERRSGATASDNGPVLYELRVPVTSLANRGPTGEVEVNELAELPLINAAGILVDSFVPGAVLVLEPATGTVTRHSVATGEVLETLLVAQSVDSSPQGLTWGPLNTLWVVGESQNLQEFVRESDEFGLNDRVRLTGTTSDGPIDVVTRVVSCIDVAVASVSSIAVGEPAGTRALTSQPLRILALTTALAVAGFLADRNGRRRRGLSS